MIPHNEENNENSIEAQMSGLTLGHNEVPDEQLELLDIESVLK